jgi:hypothetical protein
MKTQIELNKTLVNLYLCALMRKKGFSETEIAETLKGSE